jgi:uncharacterized repeat protein (TIGR01451 family)
MIGAGGLQSFTITADLTDFNAALNGNEDGWAFATMNLAASGQESLHVPIAVRKAYSSNEALLGKTPDDLTVLPGQFVTYTIHLENHDEVTNTYQITDTLPAGLTFVPGSATINGVPGGLVHNSGVLTWSGDLGPGAMDYVVTDVTGQVSYVNWADLSNTPEEICATYFPGDCDNAPIVFPLEGTFTYYRDELEDIIVNSDGYLHGLDGWLGSAYLPFNHHFPDTTELNQVIAGLWRNMDMTSAASELYAGVTNEVLPSGDQTFYASWDSAPRFTGFEGGPNVITSHGIALVLDGAGQTEPAGRIYFLYGTINGNLDLYGYTVGVENKTGTQGTTYAFDQCNFQVGDPILCIPHASVGSAPTSNMALRLDPVTLSENYFVTLTYQAEVTEATPGAVLTNNVEITSDSPDPDAQLMSAKADVTVTGVNRNPAHGRICQQQPRRTG